MSIALQAKESSGFTTYETDVLVIGAGIAGATAAIEAAQAGVKVLVLAKGPITKTGISPVAFTGYTAVSGLDKEDSSDLHFRDTVVAGRYLCDQNLVQVLTNEGEQSVRMLAEFGVNFHKENGKYVLRQGPGMSRPRMLRVPVGGKHLMDVLAKQVAKYPNVSLMSDVAVSELLQNEKRVVGALVLDLKTGGHFVVSAKAIVLAAGGKGQLWPYTDCPSESTGDGLVLAYRAGADLVDLEQEMFYPTVVIYPEHLRGLGMTYETFLKPGAKILNGLGEDIVRVGDQPPTRDQLANLIFKEISEGRGTEHGGVSIDLRDAPQSLKRYVKDYLPAFKRLKYFGFDVTKELLEVAPAAHTSLGGVHIDEQTRTGVEGLFACGETAGNVHGANRLAGQAWLDCTVFGTRAGRFAAEFAGRSDLPPAEPDRIRVAAEELKRLIGPKEGKGPRPGEALAEVKSLMWQYVGLRRKRPLMQEGLARIEAIKEHHLSTLAVDQSPGYNLDRAEALQARNLLEICEMVIRASLFREESRGCHFREDFPVQDNVNWLAHTVIRKEKGQMKVTKTPVILSRLHP